MEEGYFQSQLPQGVEPEDDKSLNVPVPSEIPQRLDLSALPDHVIKSGAIESLIQQNDDLMARLSVNLRRASFLEEQINDFKKSNEQYRQRYNNLKDQVMVLKERGRAVTERTKGRDEKFTKLKEDLRLLEIRYAELYTNSQDRQNTLMAKIEGLSKRIRRFVSYRRRIRDVADAVIKELRATNSHLDLENQKMHEAIINLEGRNQALNKTVNETTEYIRTQGREAKDNQEKLVNKYEDELNKIRTELSTVREENIDLQGEVSKIEGLYTEKTELENRLVVSERREEETRIRSTAEVSDIQQSLVRFRNEAKAQALENDRLVEENEELHDKFNEAAEARGHSEEQVENLQVLWRDNQNKIEKQQEKIRALQRLNQQLSINMNQYRKELKELKNRMDMAQLQTTEKVREIQSQVRTASDLQPNTDTPVMPEVIEKIDKLLVEIHSGFRSGSSEEVDDEASS